MKHRNIRFINSSVLHIIAMGLMLLDHMWGTVMQGNDWMTNIGRLTFPIFAFMIVEGYFHTHNLKRYFIRLLVGAVISEIPFNLMLGGYWIDPFNQNVMWTLMIGLLCIHLSEKFRKKIHNKKAEKSGTASEKTSFLEIIVALPVFAVGALLALATFVDYSYYGVLMVGVFYVFRGRKWYQMLGQLVGMFLINWVLFKGMVIDVNLFGHTFEIVQQGLAVFGLIPVWLYNGKKGFGGKKFQLICYLYYPVHILVLSLIALNM